MRNKIENCIHNTTDSNIKFEENKRKIVFQNKQRRLYHCVDVDGCTITDGAKCDKLLLSEDEHDEYYVELKGVDVIHAIDQLESTINRLGEFEDNRHSFVICTNVAPSLTTQIQIKCSLFKKSYKSDLVIREKQYNVSLY